MALPVFFMVLCLVAAGIAAPAPLARDDNDDDTSFVVNVHEVPHLKISGHYPRYPSAETYHDD